MNMKMKRRTKKMRNRESKRTIELHEEEVYEDEYEDE